MSDNIRVAIVDDHPLYREGVGHLISMTLGCELVAQGANGHDAVTIAEQFAPDIILMDINLPGNGIEALKIISATGAVIKTIMLTASENEDDLSAALSAGARGYIVKGIGGDQLIRIVQSVHNGKGYVEPSLAGSLLAPASNRRRNATQLQTLTRREQDILDRVADGQTNKEIARSLNIAEKTVKHYMTGILTKLQVRNRVEAALIAYQYKSSART